MTQKPLVLLVLSMTLSTASAIEINTYQDNVHASTVVKNVRDSEKGHSDYNKSYKRRFALRKELLNKRLAELQCESDGIRIETSYFNSQIASFDK